MIQVNATPTQQRDDDGMRKGITVLPLLLLALPAAGEDAFDLLVSGGKADFDLRYRYESVKQDGKPLTAGANTLRFRLGLASGEVAGFSGFLELDHNEALGEQRYDDTRNGLTDYPVIADPEGTDLNQAYLQYLGPSEMLVRVGRQRINIDNQRFVGSSDWRQNEQTFDAFRIETKRLKGATFDYIFVDRVDRVFGPDSGTPPATLASSSHFLNMKVTSLPVGAIVAYGYFLDFQDAPQFSSDSMGARYEGKWKLGEGWSFGWGLEYARQQDAGENPASVDAHYGLLDLHLQTANIDFFVGQETLSGERGTFAANDNPAFQTPLATLHKWQGWADKFPTTPPAGMEDTYVGFNTKLAGWNWQATWHDFSADATELHYGSEIDLAVRRKFAERYDLLLKYADYAADDGFTNTRKLWVQFGATF